MRSITILILIITSLSASAQHFEWAASAGNIDIRYSFSSVDKANNIVVGGPGGVSWVHRGAPELYNATGDATRLTSMENTDVVVSYSPEGKMLWYLQTDRRGAELNGIAHNEEDLTVLLMEVKSKYFWSGLSRRSYYDEEDNTDKSTGYYLIYLDSEGRYKNHKKIFTKEPNRINISGFTQYPNGGFLLSGFANPGKLCDELPNTAGAGGGDFVLLLDKDGKPDWADIVSYAKKTCCTYSSDMCKASAAPDGTVYLTGTYFGGGSFGNGAKTFVTPVKDKTTNPDNIIEAYIASYSPRGKLNWVKTSVDKAWSHSVAANNQGVVVAIKLGAGNSFLGEKVDTTGSKQWVLAMLDKSGKVKWKTTSSTDRAHDIRFDQQNHVYVLGTHGEVGKSSGAVGVIGSDTLRGRFTKVYIAKFAPDGKYQWVKEAEMPVTTSNEMLHFNMDHCGNMYVSGTLWFSFTAQLSMFDKAFVKGKIYGPAPFISRFKNTLPQALVKTPQPQATCILSPGPWKLRNYPNPFSTATTFEYVVSYPDAVTLQLFDLNGRLLQTLIQNEKRTAGKYTYAFTGILPAATYIAILKGTETMVTCKIVVAK